MAQFARPDSDVTTTNWVGGFAEIDEVTPSDAEFARHALGASAELEVGLSDVTDPASSSGHTVRYRIAKVTGAGAVNAAGGSPTVTARLIQGTTQIAIGAAEIATGTWTEHSFTLTGGEADAITDYDDLRLGFLSVTDGGGVSTRRGAVSWAELEVPDVAGGGTTFFITPSGAITPSGILIKRAQLRRAGAISSSGVILRETQKRFSAGVTPSGDLRRSLDRSLSGAITPTGTVTRETQKILTGTITPTGTVASQIVIQRAFSGAITMAGVLLRSITKALVGSLAPTGTLTKQLPRTYSGSITPIGALTKETQKTFAGSIIPTGTVTRTVGKFLIGAITSTGILIHRIGKLFAGSITPAGNSSHIKLGGLVFGGSITPTGNLTRNLSRTLTGSLTPIGVLTRKLSRSLAGSITPTGTLTTTRKFLISLSGTLSLAGTVTRRIGKTFTATVMSTGMVTRRISKTLTGNILPTATLNVSRVFRIALQGTISFVGDLTNALIPGGAIDFVRDRRDWLFRRRDYDPKDRVYKATRRDYR